MVNCDIDKQCYDRLLDYPSLYNVYYIFSEFDVVEKHDTDDDFELVG